MNKTFKRVMLYTSLLSFVTYSGYNLTNNISTETVCHVDLNDIEHIERFRKQVVAHRGLSSIEVENSYRAVKAAFNSDAIDTVEVDIQLTEDGHVVLFHDETLNKLTNGNGKVKNKTLKEVKSLDYYDRHVSHYVEAFTRFDSQRRKDLLELGKITKIATLNEILTIDTDKTLLIDIKFDENNSDELINALAKTIKSYRGEMKFIFQSADAKNLKALREILPGYDYQILISSKKDYEENFNDFDHLSIKHSVLNQDMVDNIFNNGKALSVWTIAEEKDYDRVFDLTSQYYDEVTYITDYPECLCYWLSKDIKTIEASHKKMVLKKGNN